ncbi:MAG: chromosomal replication initiator protein DnaA [Arenicella sp.]
MKNTELWNNCLERLESTLSENDFNTWVRPLQSELSGTILNIFAPNRFVCDWLNDNLGQQLLDTVQHFMGMEYEVNVIIGSSEAEAEKPVVDNTVASDGLSVEEIKEHNVNTLNPAFTFDTHIEGKSNQIARAATQQVGENPGEAYNPLFIYGGVGLGKTHLMHAAGNLLCAQKKNAKVAYIHSERFVSDMVKAIQSNKMTVFKSFYRSLDALLIDDIQFFAGKDQSQEEFFHTFNNLLESGSQIIITSDKFPKEINNLQERLISRFESGLLVRIDPPGLETRVAILQKKAQKKNISLPDDVAFMVAKKIRSNVRELEGALHRLIASSHFTKRDIDLDLARETLQDLTQFQERQISIENIQKTVADYYNMRVVELKSKKRSRQIARPRQIAMALAKELTNLSLPDIGDSFGGRDHTTVLYACRKVDELIKSDSRIKEDYEKLQKIMLV